MCSFEVEDRVTPPAQSVWRSGSAAAAGQVNTLLLLSGYSDFMMLKYIYLSLLLDFMALV